MPIMTRDIAHLQLAALSALQALIADGGDRFTWSLSKSGRIWMTLAYWGDAQYSTSVELSAMDGPDMVTPALVVLLYTHAIKRFHGGAPANSWLGLDGTRNAIDIAGAWFRSHPSLTGDSTEAPAKDTTE